MDKTKKINRWETLLQTSATRRDAINDIKNAPILTEVARQRAETFANAEEKIFPQFGLLASIDNPQTGSEIVHVNVAAPSSIFICGNQGSGKSHTLSCLLENCLLPSNANELPRPLTGIVFHYDTFIAENAGSPCEAAFLSTEPQLKVRVLCAPTNVATIKATYARFPNVVISELRINENDLNTKRMMDLMATKVGSTMPLYMHIVKRILRDLRIQQQATGDDFSYREFRKQIDKVDLSEAQRTPLEQRLDTLESFMAKAPAGPVTNVDQGGKKGTKANKKQSNQVSQAAPGINWRSKPGQLTIIDLSCPTVDPESACQLFNICLSLFLEQDPSSVGRVIALDEAHKYMNSSGEASTLTDQLLSAIRLQRHLGARVIISTQEPTVSPKLLDLCSVTIVHRFTSPEWLRALQNHLAGVSSRSRMLARASSSASSCGEGSSRGDKDSGNEDSDIAGLARVLKTLTIKAEGNTEKEAAMSLFGKIVQMRVGEALVFAPSALLDVHAGARPRKLSNGVLKVQVRTRVTVDGGQSVMAD